MKKLLIILSVFTGSVGMAFLLLVCMAWMVTSVTPAHSQVVERSRSTQSSDEQARQNARQASKTNSQSASRTYTISQLFFRQLAGLETEGARLAEEAGGDAGRIDPALPGAWLMSIECKVFQPTRFVYTQSHRVPTVSQSALDFEEPNFVQGVSDKAEVRRQFLPLLGEPLLANKFVACVNLYSQLIDGAARRLATGGQLIGDRVVVRDLEAASGQALLEEIASVKFKPSNAHLWITAPVATGTTCLLPTPTALQGGQTTFRCGAWEVSQRPLRAVESGQVVLDEQQARGVQYAFVDQADVTSATTATKSNTKTDAKRRSEDRKARVQVQVNP
jgi:hypothetical protein